MTDEVPSQSEIPKKRRGRPKKSPEDLRDSVGVSLTPELALVLADAKTRHGWSRSRTIELAIGLLRAVEAHPDWPEIVGCEGGPDRAAQWLVSKAMAKATVVIEDADMDLLMQIRDHVERGQTQ